MKQIPGFPNYSITKDGGVWSAPRTKSKGGWLKPYFHKFGYPMVGLYRDKIRRRAAIHTLMLETYIGLRPNKTGCRHLNGNPADNRLKNLCWGSQSENIKDAVKHGTHPSLGRVGTQNPVSKLTENQVILIFNAYHDGAYTQKELASYFNISPACVQKIVGKQMWSYLWGN